MLSGIQLPDIFNKHRYGPVGIGDKLYLIRVAVFFHRDRDLNAGVGSDPLLFKFFNGLFAFRRHGFFFHVVPDCPQIPFL